MSSTAELPERSVVLSGVGISEVGRRLDRSPMQLTLDAIEPAVADAGLAMRDIDGIATFPGPTTAFIPGFIGPDLWSVSDALGLRPGWNMSGFQGSAQMTAIVAAILAVNAGLCRHAVVFRTTTEGSGQGTGQRAGQLEGAPESPEGYEWLFATGVVSAVSWFAFYAQRYLHTYGATREQLGWIPIVERRHAALNPWAVYQAPLTIDDYLAARMISSPLGLYDCDAPVDASTAFIISRAETVPDLRDPVGIEAVATAVRHRPHWELWDDMSTMVTHDVGAQLWERTDLQPADLDLVQVYDGFSIICLNWLEGLGICKLGEGASYIDGGARISLGGDMPVNTWGGQLSGGRLHGFGFLAEAMTQLRRDAGARQVPDAEVAAVGMGGAHMGGAMIVRRWR